MIPQQQQPGRRRDRQPWKALRAAAAAISIAVGGSIAFLTFALGHCSAFGGTCPSPEFLQGDIIGGIASGLALAIGGPLIAWQPDRAGILRAVVIAGPFSLIVALAVTPYLTGR